MTQRTGCRISKVRPKSGDAEIVLLQTPPPENRLVPVLVRALAQARKGKVRSYAAVFRVENDDGSMCFVESHGRVPDEEGGDIAMIIGGMESLKRRMLDAADAAGMWRSLDDDV